MSKFVGGSAFAMARDIGGGYITVTQRTFKNMSGAEIRQLQFEIDRLLRDLRGSQLATDEQELVRARNRKIQRLTTAMMVARLYLQTSRK